MSTHPQPVAASPGDFGACAPSVSQEFVQIPKVEHILVEQPVTYKMYKKKVTMVNVPVVQSYSKVTMGSQEVNHCGAPAAPKVRAAAAVVQQDPPVYGCQAGPFRRSSYGPVPGPSPDNVPITMTAAGAPAIVTPGAYYYAGAQANPNYNMIAGDYAAAGDMLPATTPKSYAALY